DNQAVPLADLGKKLAQDLRPVFLTALEQKLADRSLPGGVAALVIKKKPHLFLLDDLTARPRPAAPPEAETKAEPPTRPAEAAIDFARLFDEAFARLEPAG